MKMENLKFDAKTAISFLIEACLFKSCGKCCGIDWCQQYPDPNPRAVAPIDAAASNAAVEQTRFDQETAHRAEIMRSAQEARAHQIRRQTQNTN